MKLYDKAGYLDTKHIEDVADKNNIAIIAIIGKRQIGKTYGVLKLMLDEDKRFILLRGMRTELDMLERNVNSPFEKIHGYESRVLFEKNSDYTANITRLDKDEDGNEVKTIIGMGAALSSIGRVRGFNGDIYTDVVFDEAIPESHLLKVRHGGDAFLNMYTTVAGNRELEGRPPLRVWLLANSNNLDSDILDALNITDIVERMSLRGEESRIIKERGIMILLPDSAEITEKRKQTALYKAIGGNSKFARINYMNMLSALIHKSKEQNTYRYGQDAREKLTTFLRSLFQYTDGEKKIQVKMTDIAEYIGETRLTVSGILNDMSKEGLLQLKRMGIIIPDIKSLR